MTLPLPPQQLVLTSLIADLRARFGAGAVGDHEAPANPSFPYLVVYSVDGGGSFAPGWRAERHISLPVQVSCVGRRRDQAQLMGDKVRDFMLERNPDGSFVQVLSSPTGWVVSGRLPGDAASGVLVEGSSPNKIYTVPLRFTLQVTPA